MSNPELTMLQFVAEIRSALGCSDADDLRVAARHIREERDALKAGRDAARPKGLLGVAKRPIPQGRFAMSDDLAPIGVFEVPAPPLHVSIPIMSVSPGATGNVSVTDGTGTRTVKIEDGKVGEWGPRLLVREAKSSPTLGDQWKALCDHDDAIAHKIWGDEPMQSFARKRETQYGKVGAFTTIAQDGWTNVGAQPSAPLSSLLPLSSFTTVGPSGPAVADDGTPMTFDREEHPPTLKRPCTVCNAVEARYFPVYSGALCHACARAKLPPLEAVPRRWPKIVAAVVGAAAAVGGVVAAWGAM